MCFMKHKYFMSINASGFFFFFLFNQFDSRLFFILLCGFAGDYGWGEEVYVP